MRKVWFLTPTLAVLLASPITLAQPAPITLEVTAHDDGLTFYFSVDGYAERNPTLTIATGTNVTVHLHNVGTSPHNFRAGGGGILCCVAVGANATGAFTMPAGEVAYYCEPHHNLGMTGRLVQPLAGQTTPSSEDRSHPATFPGLALVLAAIFLVSLRPRRPD